MTENSSDKDIFMIDNKVSESDDIKPNDVSTEVKENALEINTNDYSPPQADVEADKDEETSMKSENEDTDDKTDTPNTNCISLLKNNKFLCISSGITIFFIFLVVVLAGSVKKENRMHIVFRTLEIVDKVGGLFIWSLHSISLVLLPWFIHFLFEDEIDNIITYYIYIFASPAMMLLNMIGCFTKIKESWFPLLLEVLIAMFLLFRLPFKSVYIFRTNDFWLGELTLMMLTFVYISSALGASTLSYMLFGRYLRIDNQIIEYPKNPHYAIVYIKYLDGFDNLKLNGSYLACYSLFTFFAVGIGFLMSFRNSFAMAIPFLILAICTVIETHAIGVLLFCQLAFHIMYMICLQFSKSRKIVTGCCVCCYDSCNTTLTTILLGDIIAFALIVFPMLAIVLDGSKDKWPWGYFIGGSIVIMFGAISHLLVAFTPETVSTVIITPLLFTAAVYLFGFGFKGYLPFIRAFTYEITYLTWSFALSFWAWANGHSPVLFKTYNALVSVSCLIIIDMYEGFGWIELVLTIVQIFFDTYMIVIVQRLDSKYIAWAVFSVAGISLLGVMAGIVVIVCGLVVVLIMAFCCKAAAGYSAYSSAVSYAQSHNLQPGDTFECDGQQWRVTSGQ